MTTLFIALGMLLILFVVSRVQGPVETLGEGSPDVALSIDETEAEIRKSQKLNSNALIQSLLFMRHL